MIKDIFKNSDDNNISYTTPSYPTQSLIEELEFLCKSYPISNLTEIKEEAKLLIERNLNSLQAYYVEKEKI